MRILSTIKNWVMPVGRRPLRILTGPFQGIQMNLTLRDQSQMYLGLFERETHPALRRLSGGIDTAVGIGAAYGEYTVFFDQDWGCPSFCVRAGHELNSFSLRES